jgi:disulfide bond formation protein DsbB
MKTSKLVLLAVAIASFVVLGAALYMQFGRNMLPCPWCVIQRYAFTAIALVCLAAAFLPDRFTKAGLGLGFIIAIGGLGAAGWLMWVQAHPSMSCGIDPLETSLNKIFTAELLPWLFKADGFCTTEYPPFLGLSVPQWSGLWFAILGVVLGRTLFRPKD